MLFFGIMLIPFVIALAIGAVVAFYFGSRESHYFRNRPVIVPEPPTSAAPAAAAKADENPALADWRAGES